jgi:hypothetical protein
VSIEEKFVDYDARLKAAGVIAQPEDYFKAGYLYGAAENVKDGVQAAPTPPAQDDELVYQFKSKASKVWGETDKEGYELLQQPQYDFTETRILYTHPADDKLRKAAEEVFEDQFLDGCKITKKLAQKLANLRAALEQSD